MLNQESSRQEGTLLINTRGLDEGEWLRPLLGRTSEKVQSQPDAAAVARMREVVLDEIERARVSLVA